MTTGTKKQSKKCDIRPDWPETPVSNKVLFRAVLVRKLPVSKN